MRISSIRELAAVLTASGFVTLDEQARALGLSRSTTWAVLKANHKASGLAAGTINQMLSSPELPPNVRVTILEYVEEKLAGLYGHNKKQLSRFTAFMVDATALGAPAGVSASLPAMATIGANVPACHCGGQGASNDRFQNQSEFA
jgi:hypothetical protein